MIMYTVIITTFFAATAFVGYVFGRISRIVSGRAKLPSRWILGAIIILVAVIARKSMVASYVSFFGLGLFMSGLRDFLKLKIYGANQSGENRFWGTD